ncbi:MAG TPA: UDP-glucuronic acid decarboxylase family protein [Candidatus Saccharimonadales bacterium]|nr:UDP-glucuronic acid decarboxylase family protein [Candidatus Saccharimonadales bacterium]
MGRVLVAGGSGFLGSHLCAALLDRGDEVVCVDNLCTGRRQNVADLQKNPKFLFVEHDITLDLPGNVIDKTYDMIANLASPASPPRYVELAIETLLVGALGTKNLLDLAKRDHARFMQASTSEVYGDPAIHPQPETYWGNVNSYGARSMYDESKRFGEAMIWVYHNQHNVNTAVLRIFNTYGPHMDPKDGRVVSNFIMQALKNEPITIYGNGEQTRSFCYASDQIAGMLALLDGNEEGPINVGNPHEFTMAELADKVLKLTGSKSELVHKPLPPDDPTQRKPDITKAKERLGWEPKVELEEGLTKTIEYFRTQL